MCCLFIRPAEQPGSWLGWLSLAAWAGAQKPGRILKQELRGQSWQPSTSQKGEEPLFHNIEDCGEEKGQGKEDEQLVCQLPAVVLGDELSAQLDGPRHGLEFFICI